MFPISVIAERIEENLDAMPPGSRDLPARQQTLSKTIQWSYNLLKEDEKRLFERIAVFNGGGTLAAIEYVCGEGISGNIANLLSALVNKNLVLAQERRDGEIQFGLLETIRHYNQERLIPKDELESLSELHAEYFILLAKEAEPHLLGPMQVPWLNRLEIEHDNLLTALAWCRTTQGQTEKELLLTGSLVTFWSIRGYFHEGREYLSAALSRPEASGRTAARADVLGKAGLLSYMQGDYPATRQGIEESLSIYRELGAAGRQGSANVLITLGDMESELGNYATADSLIKEALGIMREINDERGIARALWQLGANILRPGNYEMATQYLEEALPLLRHLGDKGHTSVALTGMAEVAIRQGDYQRAIKLEEEGLAMRREIGDTWGIAVSLGNFAWVALCQEDYERAVTLLGESLALRREIGDRCGVAWCLEKLAKIALTIGQWETAPQRDGSFRRAARLIGAAEALRTPVKSAIDSVDQPEYERLVAIIRSQLGKASFSVAWAEGQTMTMEQAVDYALGDE
jgi:tetratricopeptide (TPR) repeat protein